MRFNVCVRKLLPAMCMFEKEVEFLGDSSPWIESVVRLLRAYVIICVLRPILLRPAIVECRQLTFPACGGGRRAAGDGRRAASGGAAARLRSRADAQLCWQDARSYHAQASQQNQNNRYIYSGVGDRKRPSIHPSILHLMKRLP